MATYILEIIHIMINRIVDLYIGLLLAENTELDEPLSKYDTKMAY